WPLNAPCNLPTRHSSDLSDISGANASTYTVTEANENHQIQVLASFTDDTSVLVSATSNATSSVVDDSSLSVTVTGTAKEGATLTATPTIGDSDDSSATIAYQWQEKHAAVLHDLSAANASTYTVTEANENHQIQVLASFTVPSTTLFRSTSNATSSVVDDSSLSVTVTGTAKEGATLTATPTIGDSDDSSATIAYQWQEKIAGVWTDISGANASTYTVTEANERSEEQTPELQSQSNLVRR